MVDDRRVGLDVQLFDFAHLEPGETHDVGTHVRRSLRHVSDLVATTRPTDI